MTPYVILTIMFVGIILIFLQIVFREIERYLSKKAAPLPVGKEGASRGEGVGEGMIEN